MIDLVLCQVVVAKFRLERVIDHLSVPLPPQKREVEVEIGDRKERLDVPKDLSGGRLEEVPKVGSLVLMWMGRRFAPLMVQGLRRVWIGVLVRHLQ